MPEVRTVDGFLVVDLLVQTADGSVDTFTMFLTELPDRLDLEPRIRWARVEA